MSFLRRKKSSTSNIQGQLSPPENNITIDNQKYNFLRNLAGRGQDYVAGFYQNAGKTSLIKEDDVATCIQEGSADFVKKYLPKGHEAAINIAELVCVKKLNGEEKVATKQPEVSNAKPWPKAIFGKGREAKTLRSIESKKNESHLQPHLAKLPHELKSDLAVGIFGSFLAGDESLHTGQFMAVYADNDPEQKGPIQHLVRIDLGARERFALYRAMNEDVDMKTSEAYKGSSLQIGKGYGNFLLENSDVNAKVVRLCMNSVDAQQIANDSIASFNKAFEKLPPDPVLRKEALLDVYAIYAKKYKYNEKELANLDLLSLQNEIVKTIEVSITTRVNALKIDATNQIDAALKQFTQMFNVPESNLTAVIRNNDFNNINKAIDEMKDIYNKGLKGNPELKKEKIKLFSEMLSHLYAAVEFSDHKNKPQLLRDISLMQQVTQDMKFTKDKMYDSLTKEMIMTKYNDRKDYGNDKMTSVIKTLSSQFSANTAVDEFAKSFISDALNQYHNPPNNPDPMSPQPVKKTP